MENLWVNLRNFHLQIHLAEASSNVANHLDSLYLWLLAFGF